jgi:hypothetical protein
LAEEMGMSEKWVRAEDAYPTDDGVLVYCPCSVIGEEDGPGVYVGLGPGQCPKCGTWYRTYIVVKRKEGGDDAG